MHTNYYKIVKQLKSFKIMLYIYIMFFMHLYKQSITLKNVLDEKHNI